MATETNDPSLTNFDVLPDSAFIQSATLAALFQTSDTTIWRWTKDGKLPKPHKLGGNTTRWRIGEVRKAIAKLAA